MSPAVKAVIAEFDGVVASRPLQRAIELVLESRGACCRNDEQRRAFSAIVATALLVDAHESLGDPDDVILSLATATLEDMVRMRAGGS